jgi:long-subunit fatty acid transport protein
MRLLFFLTTLSFILSFVKGQQINWPRSAASEGRGATGLAQTNDISALQNLGALSLSDRSLVAISYHNSYFLNDLNTLQLGLLLGQSNNAYGLEISTLGTEYYRTSTIGLAFGKTLGQRLSTGIKLSYHRLSQTYYSDAQVLTLSLGLVAKINQRLNYGMQLDNPFAGKVKGVYQNYRTQSVLRLGVDYQVSRLQLLAEIEAQNPNTWVFHGGISYLLTDDFVVRAGVEFPNQLLACGFGYKWQHLVVDAYYKYHFVLGSNGGTTISYVF